jgi:phosphoribosylformylglycinamidine cyclo-ligase
MLKLPWDARPPELGGTTVAEEMLRPTIIYADAFRTLKSLPWKAAAHITGGGLVENPPRVFTGDSLDFEWIPGSWDVPGIFKLIASAGVEPEEMRRTFNMGIGMIIIVPPDAADEICKAIANARVIGKLIKR